MAEEKTEKEMERGKRQKERRRETEKGRIHREGNDGRKWNRGGETKMRQQRNEGVIYEGVIMSTCLKLATHRVRVFQVGILI